ncbi:MAG: hypothetical protein AAF202_12430, partial [Pseudomonadota bacterium]
DLEAVETLWVQYESADVDWRLGFIEVYYDPLGTRGYHEGFIQLNRVDAEAKDRVSTMVANFQMLEGLMPVDPKYRREAGEDFPMPKAESVYFV